MPPITNLLSTGTAAAVSAEQVIPMGSRVRVGLKQVIPRTTIAAPTAVEIQVKDDAGDFYAVALLNADSHSTILEGPVTFRVYRINGRAGVYIETTDVAVPAAPVPWTFAAPASGTNNTTPVTIKAAAGASLRNYISSLQIVQEGVLLGAEIAVRDGSGGTVLWRGRAHPAAGNFAIEFAQPLRGSANTLLEYVLSAGTSGSVYVNAQGYHA